MPHLHKEPADSAKKDNRFFLYTTNAL